MKLDWTDLAALGAIGDALDKAHIGYFRVELPDEVTILLPGGKSFTVVKETKSDEFDSWSEYVIRLEKQDEEKRPLLVAPG